MHSKGRKVIIKNKNFTSLPTAFESGVARLGRGGGFIAKEEK